MYGLFIGLALMAFVSEATIGCNVGATSARGTRGDSRGSRVGSIRKRAAFSHTNEAWRDKVRAFDVHYGP